MERNKTKTLSADDTIQKMDKLKLLELVSDYSKVAGYMVNNWQKLTTFLYASSEKQVESEIRKQCHLHPIHPIPPSNAVLGINISFFFLNVYDLYEENYQTLEFFLDLFF